MLWIPACVGMTEGVGKNIAVDKNQIYVYYVRSCFGIVHR